MKRREFLKKIGLGGIATASIGLVGKSATGTELVITNEKPHKEKILGLRNSNIIYDDFIHERIVFEKEYLTKIVLDCAILGEKKVSPVYPYGNLQNNILLIDHNDTECGTIEIMELNVYHSADSLSSIYIKGIFNGSLSVENTEIKDFSEWSILHRRALYKIGVNKYSITNITHFTPELFEYKQQPPLLCNMHKDTIEIKIS